MPGARLFEIPAAARRALALLLAAATIVYASLLAVTYFQATAPSSYFPDWSELPRLIYKSDQPVSRVERLLVSSEGEMNSGGTMRPAFSEESVDWPSLTGPLDGAAMAALRAEREGERLAVLDWVRTGASATAYEQDDYSLAQPEAIAALTAAYQISPSASDPSSPSRVRIRSLLNDRCVSCHGPNGRHDTARFIELNSYERLKPHLASERDEHPARPWLRGALVAIFPFALLASSLFAFSRQPVVVRAILVSVTTCSLIALAAAWTTGPMTASVLIAAVTIATIAALFQALAAFKELLDKPAN